MNCVGVRYMKGVEELYGLYIPMVLFKCSEPASKSEQYMRFQSPVMARSSWIIELWEALVPHTFDLSVRSYEQNMQTLIDRATGSQSPMLTSVMKLHPMSYTLLRILWPSSLTFLQRTKHAF